MKIDTVELQQAIARLPQIGYRVGDHYHVAVRQTLTCVDRITPPNMPVSAPRATFQLLETESGVSWHLVDWPIEEKE